MEFVLYLFAVIFGESFSSSSSLGIKGKGQNWAVLVAGSYNWWNYGHQANVCHAFQCLVARGIPKSNIIVMMYDDLANNTERNPHPGTMIHQPKGTDVYHGVNKDYVGEGVNPQNFLKVLLGNPELRARGKKVLGSGPDDNVFIYFSDHGAAMSILFPHERLSAQDLISTLKQMHERKRYNKLLLHLDCCESGSMLDGLLANDISIYAMTSAKTDETSYRCYCNGELHTCLASEFGLAWMFDLDTREKPGDETVGQQMNLIKDRVKRSHPQEYGDLSIRNMSLSTFFGRIDPPPIPEQPGDCSDYMSGVDAPLRLMEMEVNHATGKERPRLQAKLDSMIEARQYAEKSIRYVLQHLCSRGHCKFSPEMMDKRNKPITRHICAEKLIQTFHSYCFNTADNPYTAKFLNAMVYIAEGLKANDLKKRCSLIASELGQTCGMIVTQNKYKQIL